MGGRSEDSFGVQAKGGYREIWQHIECMNTPPVIVTCDRYDSSLIEHDRSNHNGLSINRFCQHNQSMMIVAAIRTSNCLSKTIKGAWILRRQGPGQCLTMSGSKYPRYYGRSLSEGGSQREHRHLKSRFCLDCQSSRRLMWRLANWKQHAGQAWPSWCVGLVLNILSKVLVWGGW